MSEPVTKLLALELARKIAAPINSCDSAKRFIGVCAQMDFVRSLGEPSSLKRNLRFCSAGKNPGVIVFTRTPLGAHSRARNALKFSTAAFAAEYVTTRESGRGAGTLAVLIMLPLPRATIAGPNSWHGKNTPPTRFKSKLACHASNGIFSNGLSGVAVTFG